MAASSTSADIERIIAKQEERTEEPISETPGVCGGYPCVGDTRIPVRLLVEAFRKTPDERTVADAYPQLTLEQIRGAFAYYRQNPVRVDEDIERNTRTLAALSAR